MGNVLAWSSLLVPVHFVHIQSAERVDAQGNYFTQFEYPNSQLVLAILQAGGAGASVPGEGQFKTTTGLTGACVWAPILEQ